MIEEIKNLEDVSTFIIHLVVEGLNFHPDDDFINYVNVDTGEPSYTPDEALMRNHLNKQCFEICERSGVDIYDVTQEIFLKETGLNKYIPLPSQSTF